MAIHKVIINPAFHRYPAEAAIIGRLVVGFGELEYAIADLVGVITQDKMVSLKVIYTLRVTSARIDIAEIVLKRAYEQARAVEAFTETFAAVRHCLKIRNMYAHCNWGDDATGGRDGGLFYTNLQAAIDQPDGYPLPWRHVDVPLLELQENYFTYALELIRHLGGLARRPGFPLWPSPLKLSPPSLHNPASQHVPAWLSEDHKAQHLAFALADEQGLPRPTPGQIRLEGDRKKAHEKKRAHARRSAAGDSKQKPKDGS